MSFSAGQARLFFSPLQGRTNTFILDGRSTNLRLARIIDQFALIVGGGLTVLDLDAFYASNSDRIFGKEKRAPDERVLILPEPGFTIESELPRLFASGSKTIVIDSFNSFYHLLSSDNAKSRGRKLAFAVSILSYFAKTESLAVFFTMYRRERQAMRGGGRSISDLTESTFTVQNRDSELEIRRERGEGDAWPGGRFSVPVRFP